MRCIGEGKMVLEEREMGLWVLREEEREERFGGGGSHGRWWEEEIVKTWF